MHDQTENRPARSGAWMIPALVVLSGAPNYLGYTLPRPVLPMIAEQLATDADDKAWIKFIIIAFISGLIAAGPVASALVNRLGYRFTFLMGSFIFVFSGMAGFFLSDLKLLVFSRSLVGFGAGVISVASITLVGDRYDPVRRSGWIGLTTGFGSFSAIITSPLAGLAGELGFRFPFLLHGIVIPIFILALFAPFDRPSSEPSEECKSESERPTGARGGSTLIPLLLVAHIVGILVTLPSIYMAFRIHDVGVFSPAIIGLSFMAVSIPDTLSSLAFGRIRSTLSGFAVFAGSFTFVMASLFLIGITSSHPIMLVGMAIYGIGNGLMHANTMYMAASSSHNRARTVGFVLAAYCTASLIGVLGMDRIFGTSDAVPPLFAMALLSGIMAAAFAAAIIRTKFLATSHRVCAVSSGDI